MLVAYSMVSTYVQTTRDYLEAAQRYSGFETSYLHVTHGAEVDPHVLDEFDVVFNNYCSRLIFEGYVCSNYLAALRAYRGLKVLAVQDEYDATDKLKAAIHDLGFHTVLTCVPQSELEKVYPRAEFPGVEFHTVFTGYVPDDLAAQAPPLKPLAERQIALGYRGRDIGPIYGRLGRDKFEIGLKMREACERVGLVSDIAMDEKSRIYGPGWFEFIGNCRAMLGTESGSNVFDFDGSIRRKYQELSQLHGRPPTYAEFEHLTAEKDRLISMGQISARVFECALMRTPMVLLRGRYSDALQPDVHYIAIEKDYSNVDAVLRRLVDTEELERMADRAYEHLVASGAFGYRAFWARLADIFSRRVAALASERQDPVAARSPAVAVAKPDASHPLFELPTQRVKSIDDYNRQLAAVAKIGLGAAASSAGLSTVKVVMPRRARFGLAVAMRRALTQAETKGALTPLDRVLLLAWYITPALIKRRVNPILAQIDYISR